MGDQAKGPKVGKFVLLLLFCFFGQNCFYLLGGHFKMGGPPGKGGHPPKNLKMPYLIILFNRGGPNKGRPIALLEKRPVFLALKIVF